MPLHPHKYSQVLGNNSPRDLFTDTDMQTQKRIVGNGWLFQVIRIIIKLVMNKDIKTNEYDYI